MSLLLKVIVCVDMDCTVFQDKADVMAAVIAWRVTNRCANGEFATIRTPSMTPEERQLVGHLCKRIADEKTSSFSTS
jgi:hypothetical protein